MQKIDLYFRPNGVKGITVDADNQASILGANITRGMQVELVLHLFHTDAADSFYSPEEFDGIVSWIWYADKDFDIKSTPLLVADEGIRVDDSGAIHVPVPETNTQGVIDYLGNAEEKTLKAELVGLEAGSTAPVFILQWEIVMRNRVGGENAGSPAPVADQNYTRAQVDALLCAAQEVQYSSDGESWHAEFQAGDQYRRYRNSAMENGEWTAEPLAMTHLYIAYATDDAGNGFTLTPTAEHCYRAEFCSPVTIAVPTLADFAAAGAVWLCYIAPQMGDLHALLDELNGEVV